MQPLAGEREVRLPRGIEFEVLPFAIADWSVRQIPGWPRHESAPARHRSSRRCAELLTRDADARGCRMTQLLAQHR